MCGIIGGTNDRWNYRGAMDAILHRGPDSQKVITDPLLTLAFVRLSIIDVRSIADQPMTSEQGDVRLVFNGEIYDYTALRETLRSKGHTFRTTSDTEVLLASYLEWGDGFVDHIDGMFAIGIYDLRSHELKLFRDRAGIKPLYYFHDGVELGFCSELKGLVKLCQNISFERDPTAVYDFLTYRYIPEPKSLYKKVYKLPPAHQLTLDLTDRKDLQLKKYWSLEADPSPQPIPIERAKEQLRDLLATSVQNQLVSDVPLGIFLSGGMDSSVVLAEASRVQKQVSTFSIGFEDATHSELHFATEVATHFQSAHHTKICSAAESENLFPNLLTWYDEPFFDTSAFPTYMVSAFAKENVTVTLSGDGGDEVFGGYRWYNLFKALQKHQNIPAALHPSLHSLKTACRYKSFPYKVLDRLDLWSLPDTLEQYAKLLRGMTDLEKAPFAALLDIPEDYDSYWFFRQHYRKELPLRTRLQYLDFHTYLPGDILTKVDRASMAVSLEVRVPLLSKALIEYSFSLPEEIRYHGGELKGLLKTAYEGTLAPSVLRRSKKGFSLPVSYSDQRSRRQQDKILDELFEIRVAS